MDKPVDPLISVIMPVYNAAPFLKGSMESILNQTFSNFEFLIFDDGSTDASTEIINEFKDDRIKLFRSDDNKGYVHHLNRGIEMARGQFIARMDADDVSIATRFEKQIGFLDQHPEVGICGTHIEIIDEHGVDLRQQYYLKENDKLRVGLLFDSCFAHPSVMFRRRLVKEGKLSYDPDLMPAEDYALWSEFEGITELANLDEILLRYREHKGQITWHKKELQQRAVDLVRKKNISRFLNRDLNQKEQVLHGSILNGDYVVSRDYVVNARLWLESLMNRGPLAEQFNTQLLNEQIGLIWFRLCTHCYKLGPWTIGAYFSSPIYRKNIGVKETIKFIAKSMVGFSPFDRQPQR